MRLITPADFKSSRWKNGKGETLELAINEQGTVDDFEWRISMASVAEDGRFSDFPGVNRCLVMLDGSGVTLTHESLEGRTSTDVLVNRLDAAQFDGHCVTTATLTDGPITDFNIMARADICRADTQLLQYPGELLLKPAVKTFVYSVIGTARCQAVDLRTRWNVPQGHLLQLDGGEFSGLAIKSDCCIAIQIHPLIKALFAESS